MIWLRFTSDDGRDTMLHVDLVAGMQVLDGVVNAVNQDGSSCPIPGVTLDQVVDYLTGVKDLSSLQSDVKVSQ